MSRFVIEEAVRRGNKARVSLAAPAGGGKTFTALTLAVELAEGGDIIVIDTERRSASLYADEFTFKTIAWEPPYDPRELASLLAELGQTFAVIVVDSLSHFWMGEGGTLDIVDAAAARARGNSYAGWKDGTPAQAQMVDAMLNSPAHVIVTMRSKTEYVLENRNGKSVPVKVGMAPVQRDGIEYEFTVTADLDIDHRLLVGKTRCSALSGKTYAPGRAGEMGKALADWLNGAPPAPPSTTTRSQTAGATPPAPTPPARPDQGSPPPGRAARPAAAPADEDRAKRVSSAWVKACMERADVAGLSADSRRELAGLVSGGRTQSLSGLHEAEGAAAMAEIERRIPVAS